MIGAIFLKEKIVAAIFFPSNWLYYIQPPNYL